MRHDDRTRVEAIRRVRAGESHSQVGKDLGISASTVRLWVVDAPEHNPAMDWFLYGKRAA